MASNSDKLIDLHEQIVPEIDKISDMLVRAGAEHVLDRIKPGEPLPADAEIAELITMLVRFRTQAVATVTATLASSIESNIESLVSRVLADYLVHSSDPVERARPAGPMSIPISAAESQCPFGFEYSAGGDLLGPAGFALEITLLGVRQICSRLPRVP